MQINLPSGSDIRIAAGEVSIEFQDKGQAHVIIALNIKSIGAFVFNEARPSTSTQVIKISPGTYPCSVVFSASGNTTLGTDYDSSLKINGILVANTNGDVQDGESDLKSAQFNLIVT